MVEKWESCSDQREGAELVWEVVAAKDEKPSDELRPPWGLGRDTRHLGGQCAREGQDTKEKQVRPPPTPPQLRADSDHVLSLLRPQCPKITQEEPRDLQAQS